MGLDQTSAPDANLLKHPPIDGTNHLEVVNPFLRPTDGQTGSDHPFTFETALYNASYDGLRINGSNRSTGDGALNGSLQIPNLWNADQTAFNFDNAAQLSFAPPGTGGDLFKGSKDLVIPAAKATPTLDNVTVASNAATEQNARDLVASHKAGDRWQSGGNDYYVDPHGALLDKNDKGVHYTGADGAHISVGKDGTASLTKGGDTVTKVSDGYHKTYADGAEVDIKTKGGDTAQVVKLPNMEVHQHKGPLQKLTPEEVQHISERGGTTVDQGQRQVRVAGVDQSGNVVEKDSGQDGATVHIKNPQGGFTDYTVKDGKVYKTGADGQPSGDAVADKDLPPGMVRAQNGSIQVGSMVLTADNQYTDQSHDVHMQNKTARVDGSTATVSSETNQETISTQDRTYNYDSTSGKFVVLNSNGSIDLSYNASNQNLYTDGAVFTPTGISDNGCLISYDGGVTDNGTQVYSDDGSYSDASTVAAQDAVTDAVTDADTSETVTDGYDASVSTVSDLSNAQNQVLAEESQVRPGSAAAGTLAYELGQIQDATALASREVDASNLAYQVGGVSNPNLTRAIVDSGAGADGVRAILRQQGLLPQDDATA